MTVIEYVIARQVHRLEEAGKRREFTREERDFLKRMAPLLRRLAEEEQRSVTRSRA